MKTSIQRLVRNSIQRHEMLRPGDKIGLAVSGGADSVALLRLFEDLRGELGVALRVLHFNHQLRGAEADADEAFVKSLANTAGIECITESADVPAIAKRHGWNLEDAARRLRYKFFERVLSEGAADCVATAHTADDQAETVLARLIRGTGLTGLSSIHPVRGKIIRPLIGVRRSDLRTYLAERKQGWREDATNLDTTRLRAHVRHQLLPELARNFSPSITERLCDLAALAREDEEFWSELAEERYQKLVTRIPRGFSVSAKELLSPMMRPPRENTASFHSHRALTHRLVRRLYTDAADGEGQLSRGHVEQVVRLANHGSSGRKLLLPGGVTVQREFGRLVFCTAGGAGKTKSGEKSSRSIQSYQYEIRLEDGPAAICITELGRSFHLKVIDWLGAERDTRREGVVLDAERLRAPLVLRNWIPGDAYRPSGRRRERKLARILIAERVGVTERALWPVLTSAGRVAWADRMPVAAEFSATDDTRTGLWIVEDAH